MGKHTVFLCLLCLSCNFLKKENKTEKEAIRHSFVEYREAVLEKDADRVLTYIDESSIRHYAYLLQVIKHSDTGTFRILGPMEKLTVLSMRQLLDKEAALNFDVHDLIKRCVKEGLLESSIIEQASIEEIDIDEGRARALLKFSGEHGVPTRFVKEAERWKMVYTSRLAQLNELLSHSAEVEGVTVNDFILSIVETMSDKKLDKSIWIPFEKR